VQSGIIFSNRSICSFWDGRMLGDSAIQTRTLMLGTLWLAFNWIKSCVNNGASIVGGSDSSLVLLYQCYSTDRQETI